MLSRSLRSAVISLALLGGSVAIAPIAHAQETTTTVAAAVPETAAPVAATPAADAAATTVAAAPAGGVAAGGGFLSNSDGSNSVLPIVLASGAVLAGLGFVASRRRRV